jgi:uncharacterized delta-60 repeat protein
MGVLGASQGWAAVGLDPGFGSDGKVLLSLGGSYGGLAALQHDGRIVVAAFDFTVARLLADGGPDPTFGSGGVVVTALGNGASATALTIDDTDRIVVVGSSEDAVVAVRYLPNGSVDSAFGQAGRVTLGMEDRFLRASGASREFAGKTLLAASSCPKAARSHVNPACDAALIRLDAAGRLDQTFGRGGIATTDFGASDGDQGTSVGAESVAVQPDGHLIASGSSCVFAFAPITCDLFVARYLPSGTLDQAFGDAGRSGSPGQQSGVVAISRDGAIIVAGTSRERLSTRDVRRPVPHLLARVARLRSGDAGLLGGRPVRGGPVFSRPMGVGGQRHGPGELLRDRQRRGRAVRWKRRRARAEVRSPSPVSASQPRRDGRLRHGLTQSDRRMLS